MIRLASIIVMLICSVAYMNAQTTLSPKAFKANLQKENGILIDVRSSEEYNSERIAGAININVNDSMFISKINKLDKQRSYFVYCGIGKRSHRAVVIMRENEFTKVFELDGGLEKWKSLGLPTETDAKFKTN